MPDVGTWAKLAAYIITIGLTLEFSHRIYCTIYRKVVTVKDDALWRSFVSVASASIPPVSVIIVTWAFCVLLDKHPMSYIGLKLGPTSLPAFGAGVAVAVVCVGLIFYVGCKETWFKVERTRLIPGTMPAFCGGAADFLLAAVFEEITMRGYTYTLINDASGPAIAIVGSAAIFAVFHLVKHPKMPLIFLVNAFLFGIVTAEARHITGALWVPIGLHFGWNMAMGPVLGLPCSGKDYESGLVYCSVKGPSWVTGGLYSPDAGILGTSALLMATCILLAFFPVH